MSCAVDGTRQMARLSCMTQWEVSVNSGNFLRTADIHYNIMKETTDSRQSTRLALTGELDAANLCAASPPTMYDHSWTNYLRKNLSCNVTAARWVWRHCRNAPKILSQGSTSRRMHGLPTDIVLVSSVHVIPSQCCVQLRVVTMLYPLIGAVER
jgi:hypothetical protein